MPTAAEIGRELEGFYRRFIEVFNREDLDRFLSSFVCAASGLG